MASVVPHGKGFRAFVYVKGKRRTKKFRLERDAEAWAKKMEQELGGGGSPMFEVAAERFLKHHLPSLSNAKNREIYEQSIRDHVLPWIGKRPIAELTRRELVDVVQKVADAGKVETAHRVGQRIRSILDYAIDCGADMKAHAAAGLSRVLPGRRQRRMRAVAPAELPALLRAIGGYPEPVTRIGLLLLAHTLTRTSELIGGRWDELRDDVWVIPGERMKRKGEDGKGIPHVVPITREVRSLLDELEPMTGESPYWLASPINPLVPISNNTLLFALYRLGYRGRMTGHGFRSVGSTILNESGLWSADAIERQLAHKEKDRVREAYHRAEYLDERRKLMAWYSSHLAALASSTAS